MILPLQIASAGTDILDAEIELLMEFFQGG